MDLNVRTATRSTFFVWARAGPPAIDRTRSPDEHRKPAQGGEGAILPSGVIEATEIIHFRLTLDWGGALADSSERYRRGDLNDKNSEFSVRVNASVYFLGTIPHPCGWCCTPEGWKSHFSWTDLGGFRFCIFL